MFQNFQNLKIVQNLRILQKKSNFHIILPLSYAIELKVAVKNIKFKDDFTTYLLKQFDYKSIGMLCSK